MSDILFQLLGIVFLVFLCVPPLWILNNIVRRGADNLHPANWPSLFGNLVFLVPGGLAIYWLSHPDQEHRLMGVMAFAAYIFILWYGGIWGSIFQSFQFSDKTTAMIWFAVVRGWSKRTN